MKLILDFGNTLQKVSVFNKNQIEFFNSYKKISVENLQKINKIYKINSVILSSVIIKQEEVEKYLKNNFNFINFNEKTPIPIKIIYDTPETLGKDRIAASIAGNYMFPQNNILIINSGTCITYDFVDEKKMYHGGAISPGIDIRFKSLHNFTAKLPLVSKKCNIALIGNTTEKAIASGVINGIIAEMNGIIEQYAKKYKNLKVILSGGDLKYFEKKIKNSIFAIPNIVLQGLNIILDYNVKKSI